MAHPLLDDRAERMARAFEWPLLVAAVLVIPVLVIQQSHFGAPWDAIATDLDWGIWLAFLAEVVAMLALVPDRLGWLRSHPLEIAIVVLTPPFLRSTFAAIRVLRLLRFVRLFRLAALARRSFSVDGLRFVALLAFVTAIAGGEAFASVEGRSAPEGVYWALCQMTTVGSGIEPVTTLGKVLAVVVTLVGIGFVAVLTGAVARRFLAETIATEVREVEAGEDEILAEVQELSARLQRLEAALRARST
jgi:voltage-gated potassium channel